MKTFLAALAVIFATYLSAPTAHAADAPAGRTVLILPFSAPENAGDYAWAGRGIQQDLVVDLTRDGSVKVLAPAGAVAAADIDAAIKAGRDAGTTTVVFGAYQVVDKTIRVTGQVVDVATGKSLESLKATGPVADLFKIEDGLSGQLVAALGGGPRWQPRDTYPPAQTTTAQTTAAAPATVRADDVSRPAPADNGSYDRPRTYTSDASSYVYASDPYASASYYPAYASPNYYQTYTYGPAYYSYPYYNYYPSYYPYGLSLSFGYSNYGHFHDGFRGGIHGSVGYLGSLGRFGGGAHGHGGRR